MITSFIVASTVMFLFLANAITWQPRTIINFLLKTIFYMYAFAGVYLVVRL